MAVETFERPEDLRRFLKPRRSEGKVLGLVPTMGALHSGHGKLIERARRECDLVVVSIFVNPAQFGPGEDLEKYPRSPAADLLFCQVRNVDVVFAPTDEAMYPEALHTWVEPGVEAEGLCGSSRPGHFRAVATVVLKLLHAVNPDRAYFGRKDLQQLAVIRRMVDDLDVPVRIVPCPTRRESDGLAVSSRNGFLTAEQRQAACVLYRALRVARERIAGGRSPKEAIGAARTVLELEPLARIDYLKVVGSDMRPIEEIGEEIGEAVHVAAAIWIGDTRLIDNITLFEEGWLDE